MNKKVEIPVRPPKQQSAEDWISESKTEAKIKPVRMTVELDPDIHRDLKIHCTIKGIWISELVRDLIQSELNKSHEVNLP